MNLFIDLLKARKLNTSRLVKKPIMVRGKDGKIFRRMQWVDPRTGLLTNESGKPKQGQKDKKTRNKPSASADSPNLTIDLPETAMAILESREKFSNLSPMEKKETIINYTVNDWESALLISERLGLESPTSKSFSTIFSYLEDNFDNIPLEKLQQHYNPKEKIIDYKNDEIIQQNRKNEQFTPKVPKRTESLDETKKKAKEHLEKLDMYDIEDFLNGCVYTDSNRMEIMAQNYAEEHPKEARKEVARIAKRKNESSRMSGDKVGKYLMYNYDELDKDFVIQMFDYLPEPTKSTPRLVPAPLGLRHTDHPFSKEEVDYRCGLVGPLDVGELTYGNLLSATSLRGGLSLEDMVSGITHEHYINNIFKGTTKEGLEQVFSGKNFYATLADFTIYNNWEVEPAAMQADMTFELKDFDEEPIGTVIRTVYRDEKGILNVHNEMFTLIEQGTGIATELYEKSEQYWRYLSDGNQVNVDMLANISIGVYAWAKKGFDFKGDEELKYARNQLRTFLDENGMDEKTVLSNCGYNSVEDLEHSWQFATLDDGAYYNLQRMDITNQARKGNLEEVQGYKYNLGKAFMLGGKSDWMGLKMLNAGSDSDAIWEIHQNGR